MADQIEICKAVMEAIRTVEAWNRNLGELKRLAEEYGPECKKFIGEEAARRGYLWSSSLKKYVHPWTMKACKGTNLIGCGWRSGQLAVVFSAQDGPRRYESETFDVPESVEQKLTNSPFPDRLYTQIVKGKYTMRRVI